MVDKHDESGEWQNQMMEKRFFKRIVLVTIFVIGVLVMSVFSYFAPVRKLQRQGYSREEAEILTERLSEGEIDEVLQSRYLPLLVQVVQSEDYQAEHLMNYLISLKRTEFTPEQIIALGNHPDFDGRIQYTEKMYEILVEPYYVTERRGRYFDYAKAQSELTSDEVVRRVNVDRDHEYYTKATVTEAEQGEKMLVNKYHYLTEEFRPKLAEMDVRYGSPGVQMEVETYAQFQKMYEAALAAGYRLYVTSGYRGYADQEWVYNDYVETVGEDEALNYAAKPGYSEHQTGRALDVFVAGETTESFAVHPAAVWLAEHAQEYGFILRYPEGKEDLTGYNYEAWHYRYVGQEAAEYIYEKGITFEEYWAVFV